MATINDNIKHKTSINTEKVNDDNHILSAGVYYKIGKFQCILNSETGDLKIIVHTNRESLKITPKSDNSIILHACI